jgi:uncharacterized membrane protein
MNKEEYISEIKKELGFMPYDDVIKAEEYFRSYFCGTQSDEEVIENLGTPHEAAKKYCAANVKGANKSASTKSKNYTGWVIAIIAAVFLSPIWAPILLCVAAIAVGLLVAVIVLSFGTWLGGGVTILNGIFQHAALADRLLQLGIGFLMFGVGLFLSWLLVWGLVNLSICIIRKITRS